MSSPHIGSYLLEAFFFIICSRFIADAVLVCDGADFPAFPPLLDDPPFDELDAVEYCLGAGGTVLLTGDVTDDLELDLCDIPAGIGADLLGLLLPPVGLPLKLAAMPARPAKGCLLVPLGDTVCNRH